MNVKEWYSAGKTALIKDLPVFYRRDGRGEALICIHGFPSSSWDFAPLWSQLTNRFDVIAHDLIGLGKSAKPNQSLTIRLQADIIEGLLIELEIDSAHILAHDLGDTVAQELLARQAEGSSKVKWKSCVFLNGGVFPETHKPLLIQKLLKSPIGPVVVQLMTKKAFRRNMTNIFSDAHPPSKEFIDETWELISENNGRSMIPKLIKYMDERRIYRERWVAPLVSKSVPTRLINGVEDPISGKHAADRYAEVVPDADIVYLDNTGHYPHVENPEDVLQAMLKFHDSL